MTHSKPDSHARGSTLPVVLIVIGTVAGLAATDLVLPAIPILPSVVTGTAESAQWVLAGFALGTGVGLLTFGELGSRYRIVDLLIASLLAFALLSLAATQVGSLVELSAVRFFQGIAASAPAVYAPVMVRILYDGPRAIAMLGRIGSIESIAPAIAPIVGVALLSAWGWTSSFYVLAAVATFLAMIWLARPDFRARFGRLETTAGGYLDLLRNRRFLRYALSQACTLGGLLIVVFSAPKVIVSGLGGTLSDFIVMQVLGISFFVVAANMTGVFTRWWGDERTILYGSALSALGCAGILLMAILGVEAIPILWCLFVLVNLGLGIRGPVGFYKALLASAENDSRGSALVILLIMLIAGGGTAAVAPRIEEGLLPLATVAALVSAASVAMLTLMRPDGRGDTR